MVDTKDPLVAQRPILNPYDYAASLVLQRLNWDRKLESWRSRTKVRKWKDEYKGKKAVILCNGPSLLDVGLSMLEGTFTFGLNKINLLFDKSSFRPSCIVAVNRFVIEQNANFCNATDIPLFLDSKGLGLVSARSTVCFLHSTNRPGFARDCSWSINQGYTVTYVAMQLAFHLVFRKWHWLAATITSPQKATPMKSRLQGMSIRVTSTPTTSREASNGICRICSKVKSLIRVQ